MTKENTINETEARELIHAYLAGQGIEITKTLLDQVLDASKDLAIEGLAKGKGIKMRGLGTIEIREHQATTYKVPDTQNADGTWNMKEVSKPAGLHIGLEVADSLKEAINASDSQFNI